MEKKPVGKVTHYFDKIGVAVVELSDELKEGDKIRFERGEGEDFEQIVQSMQIDKQPVKEAKAGQAIGLKVDHPVKENFKVFKIVE